MIKDTRVNYMPAEPECIENTTQLTAVELVKMQKAQRRCLRRRISREKKAQREYKRVHEQNIKLQNKLNELQKNRSFES